MKNHDGNAFRRWALCVALAGVSLSLPTHAAPLGKTSGLTGQTLGNTTSFSIPGAPGNLPATAPTGGSYSVPTGDWSWTILDAGGSGSASTWNGSGPQAKTKTNMPVPGQPGPSIPIDVTAKPVKSSLGKALANFAKKTAPGVGTAVAIWELLGELGITPMPGANGGDTTFQKNGTQAGTEVRACNNYSYCTSWRNNFEEVYAEAMEGELSFWRGSCGFNYNGLSWSGGGANRTLIVLTCNGTAVQATSPYTGQSRPTSEATPPTPMSEQEVADEIASKSGWPTSSAIGRAAAEAINSGRTVEMDTPKVSGPASSPGPAKTETTTKPDGTTETKTTNTTNNYTYNNNTVTVTNVTTTTTNNNGQTTTTTTQEEPKEDDPCKANPNRAGCSDLDTPDGEIPKSSRALTYAAESLGLSGGTCPPPITKSIGGHTVTVFSYSQGCTWLADYVRPMVLLVSAWIAFLILSPGAPTVRGE